MLRADVVLTPTPEIQHDAAPETEDTPHARHGTELSRRNVANVWELLCGCRVLGAIQKLVLSCSVPVPVIFVCCLVLYLYLLQLIICEVSIQI